MTVFEPSYLERDGWSGAEHVWLRAVGGAHKPKGVFAVNASIDQAAINLGIATLLGACIGFERQWRQRMAGLRTNTLVAIGAASFVVFSGLFPGEDSPTRMAAQVVSGIGFLGAGIIFREGLHVTGLNTAATLWCSAAVGLLAGSGHPLPCKAPATDSSACGGLKAMTWRKAGASKSLRSSRPSPRATPFLNRSSAA